MFLAMSFTHIMEVTANNDSEVKVKEYQTYQCDQHHHVLTALPLLRSMRQERAVTQLSLSLLAIR